MRKYITILIFITAIVFIFAIGIIYFNQSSGKLNTLEKLTSSPIKTSKETIIVKQSPEELSKAISEIELMNDNLKYEFSKYESYEVSWVNYGIAWKRRLLDISNRYQLNRTLNIEESNFDVKYNLITAVRDLQVLQQQYNLSLVGEESTYPEFEKKVLKDISEAKKQLP